MKNQKVDLKSHVRNIPDFPKPGIIFKDISPLLENPKLFKYIVDKMAASLKLSKVDKIAGIDARGFLLAAPIAYKLGSGLVMIRKKGKLPFKTISKKYSLEYGTSELQIHSDSIKKGERVVIIDDVLATGGTVNAAAKLVRKSGGDLVGLTFLIELTELNGRKKLTYDNVKSLIKY